MDDKEKWKLMPLEPTEKQLMPIRRRMQLESFRIRLEEDLGHDLAYDLYREILATVPEKETSK